MNFEDSLGGQWSRYCPRCNSNYYGLISDLEGKTQEGHLYCPECGYESIGCPNCGGEGYFVYRELYESRLTGEVVWGCVICGHFKKVKKVKELRELISELFLDHRRRRFMGIPVLKMSELMGLEVHEHHLLRTSELGVKGAHARLFLIDGKVVIDELTANRLDEAIKIMGALQVASEEHRCQKN